MSEIKREPIRISIDPISDDARYYDAFDENHTLADIARWIMRNRTEAETVRDLLNEMLETNGLQRQQERE